MVLGMFLLKALEREIKLWILKCKNKKKKKKEKKRRRKKKRKRNK